MELITVGRVNLDLYAQQTGMRFEDVDGFDPMVGGSPTNVAVATSRLGVRAGVFTAVGEDLVGNWVLGALEREGVDTTFALRKSGPHTSLALRAQLPPDHALAFYRHDPADVHLTIEDASRLPLAESPAVLVSADALARGSTAEATRWILETAGDSNSTVYLDLDFREVNWADLDAYAAGVAPSIVHADVVLGTVEEFASVLGMRSNESAASVLEGLLDRLGGGQSRTLIVKQGDRGATFHLGDHEFDVPAEAVAEASAIGAGDAFAAGLIYARLRGADWPEAGRTASACAAITVSRFGCSSGFPFPGDLERFVAREKAVEASR